MRVAFLPREAAGSRDDMMVLKSEAPNENYRFMGSSVPGQLFLPKEQATLKFNFDKGSDNSSVRDFAIEMQEITTRGIRVRAVRGGSRHLWKRAVDCSGRPARAGAAYGGLRGSSARSLRSRVFRCRRSSARPSAGMNIWRMPRTGHTYFSTSVGNNWVLQAGSLPDR